MTTVSILGTEFLLDGQPTYRGRTCEGRAIQGMLFNVRAVQATFDDANPETRRQWAYPDTGTWGPDLHYAPRPRKNEGPLAALNGFQTPPVNWTINTPFKRAFFGRAAEVTGYPGGGQDTASSRAAPSQTGGCPRVQATVVPEAEQGQNLLGEQQQVESSVEIPDKTS